MDIVQVIQTLDPATGGPPWVALDLSLALARQGHRVRLVSFTDSAVLPTVEQMVEAGRAESGLILDHRPRPGLMRWVQGTAVREAIAGHGPVDLVHLHGLWGPPILGAARAARQAGVPYILSPHGMLDTWALRQKRLKKALLMAVCVRRMLNRAAGVHALNPDEKRLMVPLQLKSPIHVVSNGIDPGRLRPLPEVGRFGAAHPQLAGRRFFLFLARLHYKKGLDILAEGFAAYRRAGGGMDLVVAGPDDGAAADFQQRIDAAGLNDHVHVVGPIYGDDKRAALRDAACFVLPSRQEGFSIAITEALACGMPVIITRDCHFPEVAEVEAGLTIDLDASQLSAAMRRIEDAPAVAAEMGRRGRDLVEQRFTWDAVAERMAEVYRTLTNPVAPGPPHRAE